MIIFVFFHIIGRINYHVLKELYVCKTNTFTNVECSCLKGRVVCGTVYGEMHLKDLLGSFVRVGYRIPVPDFYLVLHGLRCRKSTIMD